MSYAARQHNAASPSTLDRPPVPVPVIDLFAGPGGLSEGFAANYNRRTVCQSVRDGSAAFRVALSIEKDPVARETLRLRA